EERRGDPEWGFAGDIDGRTTHRRGNVVGSRAFRSRSRQHDAVAFGRERVADGREPSHGPAARGIARTGMQANEGLVDESAETRVLAKGRAVLVAYRERDTVVVRRTVERAR